MSTIGSLISSEKVYKKSSHRRHNSGEINVFEAAKYFSDGNNLSNASNLAQKYTTNKNSGVCATLDMQMGSNSVEKKMTKEKKYKQPSSPGGRLANFLNSIFNQTSKKKNSKSTTHSMKDHEDKTSKKKRRSSISDFSRFRTQTPSKSFKDIKKQMNVHVKSSFEVFDEKLKLCNAYSDNPRTGFSGKDRIRENDEKESNEKAIKILTRNQDDDGLESDSSSDLFELVNYDLGYYSSGLPVYETTHVDSIVST